MVPLCQNLKIGMWCPTCGRKNGKSAKSEKKSNSQNKDIKTDERKACHQLGFEAYKSLHLGKL